MQLYSRKQLQIAGCLYFGPLLYGFAGGWTAPIIPMLQDPERTPLTDLITKSEASWIASVLYIGLIIGPCLTGYLSNVIGRKPCLLAGGATIGASSAMLAVSNTLVMIIASRIITGVGIGIIFVINLVYIAEIASTSIRGLLLTLCAVSASSGTLLMYSIGPYVPYAVTSYIAVGLSLVYIAAILVVPETPIFYLLKGQEKKAIDILTLLGRSKDINELLAAKIDATKAGKQNWTKIFTLRSNRRALTITLVLGILEHASGVSVVLFFTTTIFNLVESFVDPNVATIIIGATLLFSSSISSLVVEKYGRKILLLISTAVCCLSLMLLGSYFYLDHIHHPVSLELQWLPVISLVVFFLSYNLGFGAIPGTFIGEMFQSNVRSLGSTITLTMGWFIGFILSTMFGFMITTLGSHVTFWLYSCASAAAFVFTAIVVPETKGKTFAEIQCILDK